MHERSLVRALIGQVKDLARNHSAATVSAVNVSVGEFSGVDAELFQLAFDEMVCATPFHGAKLNLRQVPLEARCEVCGAEFKVPGFRFRCQTCESTSTTITRGESLLLESVLMEQAEQ